MEENTTLTLNKIENFVSYKSKAFVNLGTKSQIGLIGMKNIVFLPTKSFAFLCMQAQSGNVDNCLEFAE
jgi:hypothetical protein